MYEEYMQNFYGYPLNGYKNTYEQGGYENQQVMYEPRYEYGFVENYPYSYNNLNYNSVFFQKRNIEQELENSYPEIYKIVYPMVRKVCAQNNRGYGKAEIDRMVEEVYSNIEVNNGAQLNITLNNDVRGGDKEKESKDEERENRQARRNNMLNDLIRILILRELLGRPRMYGTKLQTTYATKTTISKVWVKKTDKTLAIC